MVSAGDHSSLVSQKITLTVSSTGEAGNVGKGWIETKRRVYRGVGSEGLDSLCYSGPCVGRAEMRAA